MKYANLSYHGGSIYKDASNEMVNIGDIIQTLAIDYLYERMGIKDEVIQIERGDLATYDGEYVILPINCMFSGYAKDLDVFAISDRIIPVFLGLAIRGDSLSKNDITYLKRFEPIGCRDEFTFNIIKKYNIKCWLNGCMTFVLPERKEKNVDKIICVDVPETIKEYLPKDREVEFLSHIQAVDRENIKQKVIEKYEYYKNNAAMIVTSRLHCASPCIAAGIPTVVVGKKFETNFFWLEKWTKLYLEEEFKEINWKVSGLDVKKEKELIIDNALRLIENTYERYSTMLDISYMYENRNNKVTMKNFAVEKIKNYLQDNWNSENEISYAIWGVSMISEEVVRFIEDNYPMAKLVQVYDKYRKFEFHGLQAQSLEELSKGKEQFVLIMGSGACEFYRKNKEEFGEGRNFYLCY